MGKLFPGGFVRATPAEGKISQAIRETGPGRDQNWMRPGVAPGWSRDDPGMVQVQGWSRDGPGMVQNDTCKQK